jgi:D-alanine transaminase
MSRVAYVNGRYLPFAEAKVHVEDRGYQLADGVYEVMAVKGGRLRRADRHMARLDRSLGALRIAWPMSHKALMVVVAELVRRNRIVDGMVYLQVTRGVAKREHAFPKAGRPSLVLTARATRPRTREWRTGVGVITIPDIRWKRPDIKSISLLPNVLGKQQAVEAGAFEAWMVDGDGFVTEGTSTNAWIVTAKDELVTRKADTAILHGVTRALLRETAGGAGLKVVERPFTVAEAKGAAEAFLTSTTSAVMPVVTIDGAPVGDGKPGAVTRRLLQVAERDGDGG